MSKFNLLMSVKKKFFPDENRLKKTHNERRHYPFSEKHFKEESLLSEADIQKEQHTSRRETDAQNRKRAKEALVLASRDIKRGEFRYWKSTLAYAVDCLNCISEFDLEVKELLSACYE